MKLLNIFENDGMININQIKKDCSTFFKLIEYDAGQMLYRGRRTAPGGIAKYQVRLDDRTPRNTPTEIHEVANEFFDDEFGHPYRNSLFVSHDQDAAFTYGEVHVIFPIGEFGFLWSNQIFDFVEYLENGEYTKKMMKKSNIHLTNDDVEKILNRLRKGGYVDSNLKAAIKAEHEIMVWCKQYYAIELDVFHDQYEEKLFDKT